MALNTVMLSVIYAECRYAECRGALKHNIWHVNCQCLYLNVAKTCDVLNCHELFTSLKMNKLTQGWHLFLTV